MPYKAKPIINPEIPAAPIKVSKVSLRLRTFNAKKSPTPIIAMADIFVKIFTKESCSTFLEINLPINFETYLEM